MLRRGGIGVLLHKGFVKTVTSVRRNVPPDGRWLGAGADVSGTDGKEKKRPGGKPQVAYIGAGCPCGTDVAPSCRYSAPDGGAGNAFYGNRTLTFLTFTHIPDGVHGLCFSLHAGMETTTSHVGKSRWLVVFPVIGPVFPECGLPDTKKGRFHAVPTLP